ncbi:DUF7594 domain-containing protein [Pedobacter glucosidilyticus]|uniref:CBM96 family carbohydrate-binding protein n=1 Tax=Pedobacter glucosidilyticus TaxID=1122941 RepID=UPI0026E9B7C3|nr:fasciclin domain-containing protein [Pedobacter glucosidilyticus]
MKKVKIFISVLIIVLIGTSCNKLQLLKDVDPNPIPAGIDLKNKTIWEFLAEDNFHENDLTEIGMYGKAIEHAGLKDLLNSDGNLTVIIPNNTAINNLITSALGYSSLQDVPPAVMKNLLLSTIISQRVRSFDLQVSETKSFESLNNDSLYFTRTVATADAYRFTINSSPRLASPSSIVRTQNLEFKNGIAHVVTSFTNYIPSTSNKDAGNATVKVDSIPVTKDSYVNGGSSTLRNTNYGSVTTMSVKNFPTDMSFTRRGITQFAVRRPSFTERIGSVEVYFFLNRIDGAGTILINEDQNIDWQENTINWNNAPIPGSVPLFSFPVNSESNFRWQTGIITSAYIDAINSNKTFINIGIFTPNTPLYYFATKEAPANRRPYMLIKSVAQTVLRDLLNTGLTVNANTGYKILTIQDLKLEGTTDKNIFYNIKTLPTNGILVINGIPAKEAGKSSFSQELMRKGGVKYLYTGTGNTDTFELEASDFQNGFYPDIINVNVSIQ